MPASNPLYRRDLAHVHNLAFGLHASRLGADLVALLEPVRARGGVVLEIGCGTGMLTKHLVDAGLDVIASDASADMLAIARREVPGAKEFRVLAFPGDPLPDVAAVVGIGHPLSYFPGAAEVHASLTAIADALPSGGLMAVDLFDLSWADEPPPAQPTGRLGDDWALITKFSQPAPDKVVRELTTFVRTDSGEYRRDHERHETVLVDTAVLPELLRRHGVEAFVGTTFHTADLPQGLVAVVGVKR